MGISTVLNNMWNQTGGTRFDKEFSLLTKYITDEVKRNNMLANNELRRIYTANKTTIKYFIDELEKHYDVETINSMIDKTILKMSEPTLVSFIRAYLNSSEIAKGNLQVLTFYNKISDFGPEAIEYIEENGIITSRKYLNVQEQIIDIKYNAIKARDESFRGELLRSVYNTLSVSEKKFVLRLIENSNFQILDTIFGNNNVSLASLLHILSSHKLDDLIINNDLVEKLGLKHLYMLIYSVLNCEYYEVVTQQIDLLIQSNRLRLLSELIESDSLNKLYSLNVNGLNAMSDREVILYIHQNPKELTIGEAA